MASKRRNMFRNKKTQETTENGRSVSTPCHSLADVLAKPADTASGMATKKVYLLRLAERDGGLVIDSSVCGPYLVGVSPRRRPPGGTLVPSGGLGLPGGWLDREFPQESTPPGGHPGPQQLHRLVETEPRVLHGRRYGPLMIKNCSVERSMKVPWSRLARWMADGAGL
ncbi:hypothetical protein AAG570_003168 [Ranatra chinensis]|uniref:Uncharacterized protein n=1 Tax=Ranatra chinensis TaxID=642074 RepID=A0ABD0YK98_9HEMI